MKLRAKILSGFFILVLMLTIAGIWTITEVSAIGSSVKQLLDENYKSIHASKMMIEALERQDSGILLLLLGKTDEGKKILKSGDSLFVKGFEIASNNVTIKNEQNIIDDIRTKYKLFSSFLNNPMIIKEREGMMNWYLSNPHDFFNDAKNAVNELMNLNSEIMFNTAAELQHRSNRALMPGIVSIIAATIFSLIFTYLVNYFFINPIINMTHSVREFVDHSTPYLVEIETKDEINELSRSIETLCHLTK